MPSVFPGELWPTSGQHFRGAPPPSRGSTASRDAREGDRPTDRGATVASLDGDGHLLNLSAQPGNTLRSQLLDLTRGDTPDRTLGFVVCTRQIIGVGSPGRKSWAQSGLPEACISRPSDTGRIKAACRRTQITPTPLREGINLGIEC